MISPTSDVYINSGFVVNWFLSSLLFMFSSFCKGHVILRFWFTSHYEYHLVGCWITLCFSDSPTSLFGCAVMMFRNVWSFQPLLLLFYKWNQSNVHGRSHYSPPTEARAFFLHSFQCPVNRESLWYGLWKQTLFLVLRESGTSLPLFLLGDSTLELGEFS